MEVKVCEVCGKTLDGSYSSSRFCSKYCRYRSQAGWKNKHHSEETKKKISESRKAWLKSHPNEHPWKKNSKFKSVPCEILKEKLRSSGIDFAEEYSDFQDHNYAIDIAFPFDKIRYRSQWQSALQ